MNLKMINKEIVKKYLKSIPISIWILGIIILVGIFLRTYNFRNWLYFYPDQARDVMIVKDYLAGKTALPLLGFKAASTKFQLGAIYYYFQIVSGKIFGVAPQTMAYPDLFFNILSIPLFYYFLKRFFKTDISLALTGLYSVSYYAIEFSRFAWNPNPMPFFILLFLISLWKFLDEKEKTAWGWIVGIGITLGVGIQLHTILLYLLTLVSLVCFFVLMKNNWRVWNKWLVIFAIVLLLNTNQIISEINHNFSNTRALFTLSVGSTEGGGVTGKAKDFALDAVCHAQANTHIISSLGNKTSCDFWTVTSNFYHKMKIKAPIDFYALTFVAVSILFSIFGYGLLICFYLKEKDQKKKTFLGLIIFYVTVSFAVIFPVIGDAPLRYYLQLFFVPFLFVGFFLESIRRRYVKIFMPAMLITCIFFVIANLKTIFSEEQLYASKNHSQPQYVVLGELEDMRDYIMTQTNDALTINMLAEGKYMQNYYKPLLYVLSERNVTLLREQKDMSNIPPNTPLFYVGEKGEYDQSSTINGFTVQQYKNFGEIGIYILNNKK